MAYQKQAQAQKTCPQCGSVLQFKKGISKSTGKPYAGYFCPNCKHVEWVNSRGKKRSPKKDNQELARIESKIDTILGILQQGNTQGSSPEMPAEDNINQDGYEQTNPYPERGGAEW